MAAQLADQPITMGHVLDMWKGAVLAEVGIPPTVITRHAAIVGHTGSGKTAGFIVPWIYHALRSGFRVVAIDVKGDLWSDLMRFAAHHPPLGLDVIVWDYRNPEQSRRWYWLAEMDDPDMLEAAAIALLGQEPVGADPYFYRRDLAVLRGILGLGGCLSRTDPSELVSLVQRQDDLKALARAAPKDLPAVRDLESYLELDADMYYRAVTGPAEALKILAWSEDFLKVTSRRDLKLDDLLSAPGLLIVGASSDNSPLGRAAAGLMFGIIHRHLNRRLRTAGAGCPVMLVLDEAPQIQKQIDLGKLTALGRSANVAIVLAMQDVMQFENEAERSAILGNCATFVSSGGLTAESADYLGKRLGTRSIATLSQSDPGPYGAIGHNSSTVTGPVLGPRELMFPPWGAATAIVHINAPEAGITTKPMILNAYRAEFAS